MMTDYQLILQLQYLTQSPLGHLVAVFLARWCVFLLVAWVFWRERTTKEATVRHAMREAVWSGLFALLIALLLSDSIARARPFVALPDVSLLVPAPLSLYSLPSAHTSFAFGVAIACLWGASRRREVLVPVGLAALVGMGRILVGVHYPSDIFAGMLVGIFSFSCVRFMHHVVRRSRTRV
ncbi:phosphatase PAP2 family protein [Patescibacteria group bacterium]|nr:phosphatase PAP2 family protein [Patescibacteria group bacterium]